jgi:hypothetical protein
MLGSLVSCLLATAALSCAAAAQPAPLHAESTAVDSADAAREAWARAAAALQRGDSASALEEVHRAAAAWPSQPAYHWARAVLAARLHDSAAVAVALARYADLGLGRDLADPAFDAYRGLPWFRWAEDAHRRNAAVLARSREHATLRDSTMWPEAVDYDSTTGRFYVGSIRHRTIVEVAPDGRERVLWAPHTAGIGAIFGVRVDAARGVLWATTAGLPQMAGFLPADTAIAALLQVRLRDGRILRRIDLPATRQHLPGDLTLAANGDVFVSDSRNPALYRLPRGGERLEEMTHPLFRSLQGVAVDSAGTVYVADYSHGLLRVDFARRAVRRLTTAWGVTTLGIDGIALHAASRSIIAVQNGTRPPQIVRFRLDAAGDAIVERRVLDRRWDIADEPTIGTLIGDEFVYVANSQWDKYDADGVRRTAIPLARPVLLGVRVD